MSLPLIEVMEQMGFGQIWRDIISGLLASSTQALLDGFPGEYIRQSGIGENSGRETRSPDVIHSYNGYSGNYVQQGRGHRSAPAAIKQKKATSDLYVRR
jgi:hypothetical protein